jgi:drug/metabolite transporter (DMT)-like permease
MLIAGILLLAYLAIFQRDKLIFNKNHFLKVLALSVFGIYLTNTFEFWGLQYLTSCKTCFIYSLSPFASALLSWWILSEKMSKKKWGGMLLGCLGMLPILLYQTTSEERAGHFFFFSWPELAVMGAAVSSVYGWILLKQLVKEMNYSPLLANGLAMSLGGLMALTHSYGVEEWRPVPVVDYLPFIICASLLILISNFICYNLYGALLKRFSATLISLAGLSTPLFSALFGWFFLSEEIAWPFFISLGIVSCGLAIFYLEELRAVNLEVAQD